MSLGLSLANHWCVPSYSSINSPTNHKFLLGNSIRLKKLRDSSLNWTAIQVIILVSYNNIKWTFIHCEPPNVKSSFKLTLIRYILESVCRLKEVAAFPFDSTFPINLVHIDLLLGISTRSSLWEGKEILLLLLLHWSQHSLTGCCCWSGFKEVFGK